MAKWYEASITGLHMIQPTIVVPPPILLAAAVIPPDAAEREATEKELRAWLDTVERAGVKAHRLIEEGHPVACILDQARSLPADLIVMGTHGLGGFDRLVLGSVTERVPRDTATGRRSRSSKRGLEMNRPMIIVAGYVVVIVAAVLALSWMLQRRLMYFPAGGVPTPREIGLTGVELVTFETSDGLALHGWFFAASGPSPRVTVLVFNGNAGNRAHRGPLAAALRRHGLQVLLVDYRGFGGNPGAPSENGLTADGRAARAYLAGRPDVDRSRLVYFGESLGTAVAVDLAVEHPPVALVLRSPFTSMSDLGQHHYPFLPVGLLLRDRFAAIDQIQRIRVPLLVIAGGHDQIVPIAISRRLYDAAVAPKTLLVLPDADHNDFALLAGDEMIQAIVRFLQPLT